MKVRKVFFLSLTIFLLLLVIGTFYDLEISKLVVDKTQRWAKFIEDYGEMPGYIVIIISISLQISSMKPKEDLKNILISGLLLIVSITLMYVILTKLIYNQNLIVLSGSVLLTIALVLVTRRYISINEEELARFRKITLLMAILSPLFFVQITKAIWGRVRYRDLLPDYSNYTPWYIPQGLTGHKSFPSGHAAMGWMLLPITILLVKSDKNLRRAIWVIVVLWGIVVSLGRIVIGAHYLTDVLISSLVSFATFYWTCFLDSKDSVKKSDFPKNE